MTIEKILGEYNITPKNHELYLEAITHSTFSNETNYVRNYQRLEFLGDAILSKASALKVFQVYPKIDEGKMTIIRSNAVSGKQLAKFTKEMELDKVIRFGNSSEKLVKNKKILADVFESLVGAIYLDQGEEKMNMFLEYNVFKFINEVGNRDLKNPKTLLQELLQVESRENVIYVVEWNGERFEAKVYHDGNLYGIGTGRNKKNAEIEAAKNALKKVKFE